MSMELWQKENYPKIKMGVVRDACEFEQKRIIKGFIDRNGIEKGKSAILSYFDKASFYALNVDQVRYKDLNAYLTREAERGSLIKCSSGRGSYLSFVFPKKELERMIDEVVETIANRAVKNLHVKEK